MLHIYPPSSSLKVMSSFTVRFRPLGTTLAECALLSTSRSEIFSAACSSGLSAMESRCDTGDILSGLLRKHKGKRHGENQAVRSVPRVISFGSWVSLETVQADIWVRCGTHRGLNTYQQSTIQTYEQMSLQCTECMFLVCVRNPR